jgi:hypothetical protein
MPGAANNNGFNTQRFAELWAGCDAGNANEAEAFGKFRELRRMAIAENLRVIDAVYRPDVMQALDDQLQPVRKENEELTKLYVQTRSWPSWRTGRNNLSRN